jgi:hypothetical protein
LGNTDWVDQADGAEPASTSLLKHGSGVVVNRNSNPPMTPMKSMIAPGISWHHCPGGDREFLLNSIRNNRYASRLLLLFIKLPGADTSSDAKACQERSSAQSV